MIDRSVKASWIERILEAFDAQGDVLPYKKIYGYVEETSKDLPPSWRAIIRRTIQYHSSDSNAFKNKRNLFYSVHGIGNGVWGLAMSPALTPNAADLSDAASTDSPTRRFTEVYRILRDTKLARSLKVLYNNKCQICNYTTTFGSFKYSEAHHIRPLGAPHNGPDEIGNLLILCPNHHVEFDYGLIAIDKSNITVIHKDVANKYNGIEIYKRDDHNIKVEHLRYHYTNIFSKEQAVLIQTSKL